MQVHQRSTTSSSSQSGSQSSTSQQHNQQGSGTSNSQQQAKLNGNEASEQSGEVTNLTQNIGKIDGMVAFNSTVGTFLDGVCPADNGVVKAKVDGEVQFTYGIVGVEFAFSLDTTLQRTKSGDLDLSMNAELQVVGVADVLLAEIKLGAYFKAGVRAKGDSGGEVLDLFWLAMAPKVESVSGKLAEVIYGDIEAFEERVLAAMDDSGSGDETDSVETSMEYGAIFGVEASGPGAKFDGDIKFGHKESTTLTKGTDGELDREEAEGFAFSTTRSLTIAGVTWTWAIEFTETDGKVKIKLGSKFPAPGDGVITHLVVGMVKKTSEIVTIVTNALEEKGRDTKADGIRNSFALLHTQAEMQANMIKGAVTGTAPKVALDGTISLGSGGKSFGMSLVLSSVYEAKTAGYATSDNRGKVSLKVGQKLIDV